MTGVIDYGAGNLHSVMNALSRLGEDARFIRAPDELLPARGKRRFEKIIFPGDGHFVRAMETLNSEGWTPAIKEWIAADRPFLGICIGLQLLFESSEEGATREARRGNGEQGTGNRDSASFPTPYSLLPAPDGGRCGGCPPAEGVATDRRAGAQGETSPSQSGLSIVKGAVLRFPGRKVPQIGWNQTVHREGSYLFAGLPQKTFFYYIHSYYAAPQDKSIIAAEADYYLTYCCAIERGALCAVQFHPEKSGERGLRLLENWLKRSKN